MENLVIDLDQLRTLSQQRFDEFDVMRYMLQGDETLTDEEIDAEVERIAEPIIAAIDCTACANCCQSLEVALTPDDASRLAQRLGLSNVILVNQFVDLERGRDVEEWGVFRHRPCVFLKGKLCSVYDHRPETCRTYPMFTPDFRWTLEYTIAGAGGCPIIYNVLSAFLRRAELLGWA